MVNKIGVFFFLPCFCYSMEEALSLPVSLPGTVKQEGNNTVIMFSKETVRKNLDGVPLKVLADYGSSMRPYCELDPQRENSSLSDLADRIVDSIETKGQIILEQGEKTAKQTQEALRQLQEGLKEMRCAQTRQRRMAYVSFGVGMCGVTLFLVNYFMQRFDQDQC